MNLLFDGLIDTPGVGKAWVYPWTARFFAGLDREVVRAMGLEAWDEASVASIGVRTHASPADLASRAGAQAFAIRTGIRPLPEMEWLMGALRGAGFDVFVVTASLQDVVAPTAARVYGIDETHVFGMRTVMQDNRYTDTVDERDGYAITFGPGKTSVIANFVGRAPLLVAGDSDTDHHMLTAFAETRVRLVIDRGQGGAMAELRARGARGEDGVVVQRRDERAGTFVA
ncbi:MAG: haloacid dehalogenase-like hydrolase, partial [Deltaproteobacteria bacterium]|nr:haloacid dehalogenase-like hydrolase [Deltaproteobacteria bacterium]